jgi:hypothetical protein
MIKFLCQMSAEAIENRGVRAVDFHTEIWLVLRCLYASGSDIEIRLKFLDCLNGILPQPQGRTSAIAPKIGYFEPTRYEFALPYFHESYCDFFLSIHHAAAYVGPLEHVEWKLKTDNILQYEL